MKHLLLRDYQGQNISGWLMSEKLDGWRVFWTGSEFVTREGNVLNAPEWFRAGLPSEILDGEVFAGRGEFNQISAMMLNNWIGLTFQVFDIPKPFVHLPHPVRWGFKCRYWYLNRLELPPHAQIVPHICCRDTQHMVELADEVVAAGGEGVVVRDPRAMYEQGRTTSALRWVPQCPRLNRRKSS